jgi:hypothetical protein
MMRILIRFACSLAIAATLIGGGLTAASAGGLWDHGWRSHSGLKHVGWRYDGFHGGIYIGRGYYPHSGGRCSRACQEFGSGSYYSGLHIPRPRYKKYYDYNGYGQSRLRLRLSGAHIAWCSDRYRSYRISDNTFKPNRHKRRLCISPFY